MFWAEQAWNQSKAEEDYRRRVSEHYEVNFDLLKDKANRTLTKLRKAELAETDSNAALEAAMEAWAKANNTHGQKQRRANEADTHHAALTPTVRVGAGVTIGAHGRLTVGHANDTGIIETQGTATFRAGKGLLLADAINPAPDTHGEIHVNADTEQDGDGTLSIAPGAPVTSAGALRITAHSLVLGDVIHATGGVLQLSPSKPRQTVSIGNMHSLPGAEA